MYSYFVYLYLGLKKSSYVPLAAVCRDSKSSSSDIADERELVDFWRITVQRENHRIMIIFPYLDII